MFEVIWQKVIVCAIAQFSVSRPLRQDFLITFIYPPVTLML
jgi:hypothetical protein